MRLFSGKYYNLIAVIFFLAAIKGIFATTGIGDTSKCYYAGPEGSPVCGIDHDESIYVCLDKTDLPHIPSIGEISGFVRGASGI